MGPGRDQSPEHGTLGVGKQSRIEEPGEHNERIPGKSSLVATELESVGRTGGRGEPRPEDANLRATLGSLGSGSPLPADLRHSYGAKLGVDLGGVRLHTGSAAPSKLGALAFTHGAHVAMAPGVDPGSRDGDHVLAHELVHVAQNIESGGPAMDLAAHMDVGPSDSPVEREAEAGAAALTTGAPFRVRARSGLPSISLFGGPAQAPPPPAAPAPHQVTTGAPAPTEVKGSAPAPAKAPSPSAVPAKAPSPSPSPSPGQSSSPVPATPRSKAPAGGAPQLPAIDDAVNQELEKRADPVARAGYGKATAQIDILRIQALQFNFQPMGLGNALLQTVWPWQTVKDHALGISSTNPYESGSLEAWIEGARNAMRVFGDIVAWLGTIADLVAAASSLLACVTAETIIGGLTFGGIATIADTVGTIAGLIKILLDLIDALLGVVQILILVDKIKKSKDPNERAVLAAQLGGECQTLASIVTTLVVEVGAIVVSAGVATGMGAAVARTTKGIARDFLDELRGELNPLIKLREARKTLADAKIARAEKAAGPKPIQTTTDPSTITPEQMAAGQVVLERTIIRKQLIKTKLPRSKRGAPQFRTTREVYRRPILRPKDLPKPPTNHRGTVHELVYVIDPNKQVIGARGVVHHILGTKVSPPVAEILVGAAGAAGQAGQPNGPTGSGASLDVGTTSLTHVAMWPTMAQKFATTAQPLPAASSHVMEQFTRAQGEAGPARAAAVNATLGATRNAAGEMRYKAVQQQVDAQEGAANSQKGSTAAQSGKDKQQQVTGQGTKIDGQVAKLGGERVEKPRPKPKNWLDQAADWVVDHTVGELGNVVGKLQGWLTRVISQWAIGHSGLTREELDMAGIDDSMRSDEQKDHKSEADAKQAEADAQKVDPVVAQLMEGATREEQAAIQGMVDAQEYLTAIDEAREALHQAILDAAAYLEQIKPILQHQLETQRAHNAIDKRYVAPGITAAEEFTRAAHDGEDIASGPAEGARQQLQQAKSEWPDLNIAPGLQQIDDAKGRFLERHQQAVGRADAAARKAIATLDGLVGTDKYGEVTAALRALEDAMGQFDADEAASAEAYEADLDSIVEAYETLVKDSVTPREIEVPGDPTDRHHPGD